MKCLKNRPALAEILPVQSRENILFLFLFYFIFLGGGVSKGVWAFTFNLNHAAGLETSGMQTQVSSAIQNDRLTLTVANPSSALNSQTKH